MIERCVSNLVYRRDNRTDEQTENQLVVAATNEKEAASIWRRSHNKLICNTHPIQKITQLVEINDGGKLNKGQHRDHGDFIVHYTDIFDCNETFFLEVKCKVKSRSESEMYNFRLKLDCFPRYLSSKRPILTCINTHTYKPLGVWLLTSDLVKIQNTYTYYKDYNFGDKEVYKVDIRKFNYFALDTLEPRTSYLDGLTKSLDQYLFHKAATEKDISV